MAGRGVHFAIDDITAERLIGCADDDTLTDLVSDEIEANASDDDQVETDKGWNGLHRCFSDGTLDQDGGEPPLNLVFFGGTALNESPDTWVVLLDPDEVAEVAAALPAVTREWLRSRYDSLEFPDYPAKSDDDFEYLWSCFDGVAAFFSRAAAAHRHVIFTVDP